MSKLSNIKVVMDKTLHSVPKFFTKNLIKHKSVKGTKVVKRESLETFHYRRAFYTTTAIILLVSIGIGYGIFAAMNIGMTKDEVKANLMNQFNNNNDVSDILDRKEVNPLTYIFNKDLDNNKVYTFTGAGDSLLEHDVTSNVYHVKDVAPVNIPDAVKRAYSKADVEANYIKSVGGVELDGLLTGRERSPNTYILKSNFNEQTVYAFTGTETETRGQPVTSNVYHVEDNYPEFVPSTVQRAYSKEDVESNYVKRLKGTALQGLESRSEVDPNTYILKDKFNSNEVYTIKGNDTEKEIIEAASSILHRGDTKDRNLLQNITSTRGYTKEAIESTYIRPHEINDLEGLETGSTLDPRLYTWDYNFSLNTAYTFSGKILTREAHIVTDSLYYVADERPNLVPIGVKRAYLKQDIEKNYVLKSRQHNLDDIDAPYERTELSNDYVYGFSGGGMNKAKDFHQITENVHYVGEARPIHVPYLVTRAYTAEEIRKNYVLKLNKDNIVGVNAEREIDPKEYIEKNTLTSNIYYQKSGIGDGLTMVKFPVTKGYIYQGIKSLEVNDSNPTLELFDFKNKQYINGDSRENLYVLDNTDSNLLKFEDINHKVNDAYEIIGERSDIDFELTDKEVLTLENKFSLFQREKVSIALNRYGRENWEWRQHSMMGRNNSKTGVYELLACNWNYSYIDLLNLASKSLPSGVHFTSKEIQHIISNMGKYKFKIHAGTQMTNHPNSYGVLLNSDNTVWDGVKSTSDKLQISRFPSNAKTKNEDYNWVITHNVKKQRISMTYYNNTPMFTGDPTCRGGLRTIQVYRDNSYR